MCTLTTQVTVIDDSKRLTTTQIKIPFLRWSATQRTPDMRLNFTCAHFTQKWPRDDIWRHLRFNRVFQNNLSRWQSVGCSSIIQSGNWNPSTRGDNLYSFRVKRNTSMFFFSLLCYSPHSLVLACFSVFQYEIWYSI